MNKICLVLSFIVGTALSAVVSPSLLSLHQPVQKRSTEQVTESTVAEGHTIELRCKANGPSPPMITWRFNNQYIEQGPLDQQAENVLAPPNPEGSEDDEEMSFFSHDYTTVSTLVIKNARSNHSGRYKCVADLPDSRITKSFQVTVTGSEHGQPAKRSESDSSETRIYLHTDEVYEFEDAAALLMCRATQGLHKPAPTVIWSINDVIVTDDMPGFKKLPNGDLLVLKVTKSLHMANIEVKAIGDDGSVDVRKPFVYLYEN